MPEKAQIVECPKCGARNRVLAERQASGRREAVCGRCQSPLPAATTRPVVVTDANFADEVERSPLPVLLDFWAAWCGPCRLIAPVIDALAGELAGRARVGKLDVDENQRTAARFRVQSIPTLLILKDGREVDRIVGLQSREALLRRLQPFMQS